MTDCNACLTFKSKEYILGDNGVMDINTLQEVQCPKGYNKEDICFSGEVMLTGVLERAVVWNERERANKGTLLFTPDKNLDLPYLPKNTSVEVEIDSKNPKLAGYLSPIMLGSEGIMFKAKLQNYTVLNKACKGKANCTTKQIFARLVEIGSVSNSKGFIEHTIKAKRLTPYSIDNQEVFVNVAHIGYAQYPILEYDSKDDFINFRGTPNGKIVGKMYQKDFQEGEAKIFLLSNSTKELKMIHNKTKGWVLVGYKTPD